MTTDEGDKATEQYSELIKDSGQLLSFDVKKDRLDNLFFHTMAVGKKFPQVAMVMRYIFCMSHGQAAVKRGFSKNNHILQNNMSGRNITSKDYLKSNGIKSHEVKINYDMKNAVKSSSLKYQQYLEDNKKTKKAKEKFY